MFVVCVCVFTYLQTSTSMCGSAELLGQTIPNKGLNKRRKEKRKKEGSGGHAAVPKSTANLQRTGWNSIEFQICRIDSSTHAHTHPSVRVLQHNVKIHIKRSQDRPNPVRWPPQYNSWHGCKSRCRKPGGLKHRGPIARIKICQSSEEAAADESARKLLGHTKPSGYGQAAMALCSVRVFSRTPVRGCLCPLNLALRRLHSSSSLHLLAMALSSCFLREKGDRPPPPPPPPPTPSPRARRETAGAACAYAWGPEPTAPPATRGDGPHNPHAAHATQEWQKAQKGPVG